MLIDKFIPKYEFHERHSRSVKATPAATLSAAKNWRPASSMLWRMLLVLRGLGGPRGTIAEWADGLGFLLLGESESEFVYGQIGRFWALHERSALVSPKTVAEFLAFNDPRYAAAAFNVALEPAGPDKTRLTTETRIHAYGASPRRWFRLYWLLIRPFSGLLRRSMLNGIAALAESTAGSE